jgi:hypothetical protein
LGHNLQPCPLSADTNIAGSSSSSSSFVNELSQLGTDLGNGDLSSAQGDMLSLDSTALNAAGASSTAGSSSSSSSNEAEIAELITASIQAMEVGDNSATGADLSQLASVSTSSTGAGYLKSDSAGYGSGSTSSSSVSQLLQSVNTNNASSSTLSLFA